MDSLLGAGSVASHCRDSVPDPETGKHYYLAIMLPGSLAGLLVGCFMAKYARKPLLDAEMAGG